MRVETAIEDARKLISEGKYDQARAVLNEHADHPKVQYWMRRLEKSMHTEQTVAPDRWFTFRWDIAVALCIILAFAAAIVVIGLSA